jgi:hypothetical protein
MIEAWDLGGPNQGIILQQLEEIHVRCPRYQVDRLLIPVLSFSILLIEPTTSSLISGRIFTLLYI